MAERESVRLWSVTSTSNATIDPSVNFAEGQLPGTVNNSMRAVMAGLARFYGDIGGALVTSGTGAAYTLTINNTWTALANNQILSFKAHSSNTSSTATINVTNADAAALGAKAIRGPGDVALALGQIVSSGRYVCQYDTSANAAAGAWVLLNPTLTVGATDNAALRADGTGGGILQASPLIIADTTGALSRSGNGGIPVQGTNTNDSASSGFVGEFLSSSRPVGSATSLTTDTSITIISLPLTAGDWSINGFVTYIQGGTTVVNTLLTSISETDNVRDSANETVTSFGGTGITGGSNPTAPTPGTVRKLLASSTTIYLIGRASFTTSTCSAWGTVTARRMR